MQDLLGEDTIVALSTPIGRGAIALIRMSGKRCLELINRSFSKTIDASHHRMAVSGEVLAGSDNQVIDECVVTYFQSPNSYTGEDVLEISCHCNPLIIDQIIQQLVLGGARLAKPGEFTRRAFLNQKGIETQVQHMPLLHQHPVYVNGAKCPNAERICTQMLCLPASEKLTATQQTYVVQSIKEFYGQVS